MSTTDPERERVAREAILRSLGTEAGEFAADLFVSHHLEELDAAFWHAHLGDADPRPEDVIGLLRPNPGCDPEDGLDFALPGDVSDSLLCVRFDDDGAVDEIAMES